MPSVVAITQENDCDFLQSFVFQNSLGAPVNLSGATLTMKFRPSGSDPSVKLAIVNVPPSTTPGIIVTDAPNGAFEIWITAAQWQAMPIGNYVHSLVASYPTNQGYPNETLPIWTGTLVLSAGPSR